MKRRLLRAVACLILGLVLGVSVYAGFVKAGLIRFPFGALAEGDIELARSDRPGQRVLFVGNSLTYYNDMPSMVRRLAAADHGAPRLFVAQYTAPGWSLRRASRHDGLRALLEEVRWDDVVLQEHSGEMDPFVDVLHPKISASGGRTILFEMMPQRHEVYAELAVELPATIAPVGDAWGEAVDRYRGFLELRADDGLHPGKAGSFLAACVFYAVLTNRNPERSGYEGGIESAKARFFKRVAWDVYRGRDTTASR